MSLEDELGAVVAAQYGEEAQVDGLVRVTGGASRELWRFNVLNGDRRHDLLLRRDPPGLQSDAEMRKHEWTGLDVAYQHGVKVPEPLFTVGDSGIVVRWLEGEGRPKRILESVAATPGGRARLLNELAEQAAKIHRLPVEAIDLPQPEFPPPEQAIIGMEDELDRLGEPHPALELGLRWLWSNVPDNREARIVHGDFRLGNVMALGAELTGVLDWELVHLGDPAEDLGWLCLRSWRFGQDDRPAAGLGSRDELLAAYHAAGGREVTREELRFWEVYSNVRWGVICVMQAETAKSTGEIERAMIGRRTCEAEWDLLAMIGED